jgi:hypothetical protein
MQEADLENVETLHSFIACECRILYWNLWKNDNVRLNKSKYMEVNWQKIYVSEIPTYCEADKNMCMDVRTYACIYTTWERPRYAAEY